MKCKWIMLILGVAFASLCGEAARRPTPAYLKSAVVYQIVLRNFTRDGNFKAATAMLDHVRFVGATPFKRDVLEEIADACRGIGSNYMLNIGPDPLGRIPADAVSLLEGLKKIHYGIG